MRRPIEYQYKLGQTAISRVTSFKDLGVTFDRTLTFHCHISTVAKESYQRLGFVLRNSREFHSIDVVKVIFSALVRSKLEASACVWHPHEDKYTLMLEKVQKAFLRYLYKREFGYYPYLYPTEFLHGALGYNSLEVRRAHDQLGTMCKILQGRIDAPDVCERLCRLFVPDSYLRGRKHKLFAGPRCRTVAHQTSPIPRSLAALNALLAAAPECDIFAVALQIYTAASSRYFRMATAKENKKVSAIGVDLPECPVCMDTMTAPVFLCQLGHSLCNKCTTTMVPPVCPICRQPMTQTRNWQLEDIVNKAKVPCPNKSSGCVVTMVNADVEDHLKECIFGEMECLFGKCYWKGQLKDIISHIEESHANVFKCSSDADIVLENININEDDFHFFFFSQGKMFFFITFKLDTLQKMAYWTVQYVGSKRVARQHIYEIHVTSNQDVRRKVVYTEHCFNNAINAYEVFRQGKCAVIPLHYLSHFIKDKKLTFRFSIKRLPTQPKA